MTAIPPPGGNGSALVRAFDRMAGRIVQSLHDLFGFQYSRNAEHYVYQVLQQAASGDGVGASYATSIRVTQEADFIATRLNANARINSTGVLIGTSSANAGAAGDYPDAPFTLLITDGSTDRQLSNQAVDAMLVYGSQGGLPGVWARPRLFARNTTISLQLVNLKAPNATWDYRVAFIGWKVYDAGALDLTSRT